MNPLTEFQSFLETALTVPRPVLWVFRDSVIQSEMARASHSAEDRGQGGDKHSTSWNTGPFEAKGHKATVDGGKGKRGRHVTQHHLCLRRDDKIPQPGAYTTDYFFTVSEL